MKHLQHSLVSEIRELIYPEDRLRFDELMFRHGITVNVGFIQIPSRFPPIIYLNSNSNAGFKQ